VWLVWLTLHRLAPERPLLALTGMGFAAFLPMHIAIGSAVGNDALTNLLFAAVLYGLLVNLRNARAFEALTSRPLSHCKEEGFPSRRGAGEEGCRGARLFAPTNPILAGLAVLTKATGILLIPTYAARRSSS
jgi:4-amino-4-deoxy-L-arabinose transferase-like glycosyltransferase